MKNEVKSDSSIDYFLPVTTRDWIQYHESLFNMHISQLNNGITYLHNGIPKKYFDRNRSSREAIATLRCLIDDIMELITEKHCS